MIFCLWCESIFHVAVHTTTLHWQQPPPGGAGWPSFGFKMFLFTAFEPSSNRLGTSIICSNDPKLAIRKDNSEHDSGYAWSCQDFTFNASSSKHCSTFSLVFALHSRNNDPSSLARAIPSSLLTALSDSWHETEIVFGL